MLVKKLKWSTKPSCDENTLSDELRDFLLSQNRFFLEGSLYLDSPFILDAIKNKIRGIGTLVCLLEKHQPIWVKME